MNLINCSGQKFVPALAALVKMVVANNFGFTFGYGSPQQTPTDATAGVKDKEVFLLCADHAVS